MTISIINPYRFVSAGGSVGTAPNSADCIAYFKFDENTGTTVDNAEGTVTYDGTISGATWITGKINSCLDFDGVNDIVNIPQSVMPWGTNTWSITFWVYHDSASGSIGYITGSGSSSTTGFQIYKHLGDLRFDVQNEIGLNAGAYSPTLGTWDFIAITSGTSGKKIYLNAVEVATSANTASIRDPSASLSNIVVGARTIAGSIDWNLNGRIDEPLFHGVELTAANITYLHQNGAPTSAQQYPFT